MSKAILEPYDAYQKAKITFVQNIAEFARRSQNIESLQSAGTSNSLINFISIIKKD